MERRIRIGCEFACLAAVSTPVTFQVRPGESEGLALDAEQWPAQPLMAIRGYTDLYGNPGRDPHGLAASCAADDRKSGR
jgi:hypothetical protein